MQQNKFPVELNRTSHTAQGSDFLTQGTESDSFINNIPPRRQNTANDVELKCWFAELWVLDYLLDELLFI